MLILLPGTKYLLLFLKQSAANAHVTNYYTIKYKLIIEVSFI